MKRIVVAGLLLSSVLSLRCTFLECLGQRFDCTLPYWTQTMMVEVADADSGEYIVDATVVITDGDYVETLMYAGSGLYDTESSREGTYTVTIEAEGYVTQTIEDVTVDTTTPCGCHLATAYLQIDLEPAE